MIAATETYFTNDEIVTKLHEERNNTCNGFYA